jgi:hypothetical protein
VAIIVELVLRKESSPNLVPQVTRPALIPNAPVSITAKVPLSLPSNQRVLVVESMTKLSTAAFALSLALIVANSIAIDKTDQPKTLRITILQN